MQKFAPELNDLLVQGVARQGRVANPIDEIAHDGIERPVAVKIFSVYLNGFFC